MGAGACDLLLPLGFHRRHQTDLVEVQAVTRRALGVGFADDVGRRVVPGALPDGCFGRLFGRLFGWFFGRAIMKLKPIGVDTDAGEDAWTLVTEGENGYPSIRTIAEADPENGDVAIPADLADAAGPAVVFSHSESEDMSDLTSTAFRGEMKEGAFVTKARPAGSQAGGAGGQRSLSANAKRAREAMKDWPVLKP